MHRPGEWVSKRCGGIEMVYERASVCLLDVRDRSASQGWTNAAGDYGKHLQTPAILVVYLVCTA